MFASLVVSLTTIESTGFTFQWFSNKDKKKQTGRVLWNEIEQIEVFKRDLFIYDLICMSMRVKNQGCLELDEDDALWSTLLKNLTRHLDGFIPWSHWFQKVAFPAFETKQMTIYPS